MDRDRALRNVAKASDEREDLARKGDHLLRQAVIAARDAGCTFRDIGDAIGMSHVGVMKILKRHDVIKGGT